MMAGYADIRRITNQPPLSSIIKSCCLIFFVHLAQMDENADASQATFEPPPENWRRPPGRLRTTWMKNIHDDLSSLDLEIHKARDLVQSRPLWRLMSLHSAMHSYWCLLLLDWMGPLKHRGNKGQGSMRQSSFEAGVPLSNKCRLLSENKLLFRATNLSARAASMIFQSAAQKHTGSL